MITAFNVSKVEGQINKPDMLSSQRFPRLGINIDKVSATAERISIEYSFNADYADSDSKDAKNVGTIKLSGSIELQETKDRVAAIMKRWDETKMLPKDLAEEVVNGLNFRCSATGTLIAYSLGLIPPLVISRTTIEEKK